MSTGTRYTKDLLATAARSCSDIDEVIEFLGTRPYAKLDQYLLRRFAHIAVPFPGGMGARPSKDGAFGPLPTRS